MKKLLKHWQKHKVIAGTTTKYFGNCQKDHNLNKLLELLKSTKERIRFPQQVHGNKVVPVTISDRKRIISGADGLITKEKKLILMVRTADCLPIFFLNNKEKIYGLIHAGWHGSLEEISRNFIHQYKKLCLNLTDLKVFIGPHICHNCYEVDKNLAQRFVKKFRTDKVIIRKEQRIFLDLGYVNKYQLICEGVREKNINSSAYCTYCSELFFSYRKMRKQTKQFPEMISFINIP